MRKSKRLFRLVTIKPIFHKDAPLHAVIIQDNGCTLSLLCDYGTRFFTTRLIAESAIEEVGEKFPIEDINRLLVSPDAFVRRLGVEMAKYSNEL